MKGKMVGDRRGEARNHYAEVPASWRHGRSDQWRDAWLDDASDSGVAIVTQGTPPRAGDEIELVCKGPRERAICRVVRTRLIEDGQIKVACRLLSPDANQAWLRPSRKDERAHRRQLRWAVVRRAA